MESMPDELEQNTSETLRLENLPTDIRSRIFMHLELDYRERIRLESVSPTWRAMALNYAWKEQRILRFSREMLHLNEPWKDTKQINSTIEDLNRQQNEVTTKLIRDESNKYNAGRLKEAQFKAMRDYQQLLTNRALYKQEKTSRQLAPLKAILHRCAPFLDELHLLGAFDIQMRFGRIFSKLTHPFGRLAHLHISVELDSWHLHKIQCHLAPQLLSLAVVPIDNVKRKNKALVAFRELLANCNKLENLQIAEINFAELFAGHSEHDGGGSQPSSSLAQIKSKCSFMPSTLKFLFFLDFAGAEDYENPDDLVNTMLSLLANCSQLRYMPILINTKLDLFTLIEERNPRELDKIIRLQFPFFIADFDYSFPYIQKRSEFRNLKAIQMNILRFEAAKILQVAKCCPNLEHLSINLLYEADLNIQNYVVDIPNLVALHQFQQLSSLEISMELNLDLDDFHKMCCPGGEQADIVFLEILTKLDQIHSLRSLDLKAGNSSIYYPSLSQDYLIRMITQLKHLETFSCGFYLQIDIDDMTGIGHFCAQLKEIFNSQEGANKKSLKFALLSNNPNEWDEFEDESIERTNLLVEWQKGSGTKLSKMNWHLSPWYLRFEPGRSIVLHELFASQFGQRTSSMLFDSFDTMKEEHR